MKIAILGYTGAGKSTLARRIGEKYDIPVLHLDKVNYTKNWKIRDIHESKEIVEDFLENESWVIDGNYSKLEQDRRVEEADIIIFLDFPRFECLKRAYKRYKENIGKTREDVAPGNTEKFDFIFIKWILIDGRNKEHRERYHKICEKYKDKVVICRNEKEVEKVYNEI